MAGGCPPLARLSDHQMAKLADLVADRVLAAIRKDKADAVAEAVAKLRAKVGWRQGGH